MKDFFIISTIIREAVRFTVNVPTPPYRVTVTTAEVLLPTGSVVLRGVNESFRVARGNWERPFVPAASF